MSGMPSGVASALRWKPSYMSAHAVGVLGLGAEPPPESSEPSRLLVMSLPLTASRSAWVIWPSFSSRLIRPNRSATRTETGWLGSLYGGTAAIARPVVSAPATSITPAATRASFLLLLLAINSVAPPQRAFTVKKPHHTGQWQSTGRRRLVDIQRHSD